MAVVAVLLADPFSRDRHRAVADGEAVEPQAGGRGDQAAEQLLPGALALEVVGLVEADDVALCTALMAFIIGVSSSCPTRWRIRRRRAGSRWLGIGFADCFSMVGSFCRGGGRGWWE